MARKVNRVVVKFIQKNAPYNVGETAGFTEAVALKLVRGKRAKFIDPPAGMDEFGKEDVVVTPTHLGGGIYDVAGSKVKGKKKAQDMADELNKRSSGSAPAPDVVEKDGE